MFTIALSMKLKPDAYAAYKKAHDELWPELARGMSKSQVSMSIYRDGDRLFIFAAAPTEEHWRTSREDPVLDRWNKQMTRFLQTDARGGIAFNSLEKAFGFGEFQ